MKKIWIRVLVIVFVCFLLLLIGLHIFVGIVGKGLLTKKLEEAFKKKITIGSLTTSFPLTVNIKTIEAQDLFKIDEVIAGGGLIDIFRGSLKLSLLRLIRPVVKLERGLPQSAVDSPLPPMPPVAGRAVDLGGVKAAPDLNRPTVRQQRLLFPNFYISRLIISDGSVAFLDKTIDKDGILIQINNLNVRIDNLNFSSRGHRITSFELKGNIPWKEGQEKGKIEAEGWINLAKKNMDATLKIEGIDGIYLYPYYANWVDLEKARIEKATLNFNSEIHGLNNDVTANCHLELTDIVRKPRPEDQHQEKAEKIADVVLDIFRALNQGKIVLDFTIRTKMDRPEFGFSNIKTAFEEKIAKGRGGKFDANDILVLPGRLIEGAFKGIANMTTAVVTSTISAGRQIVDAVGGSFKKEKQY